MEAPAPAYAPQVVPQGYPQQQQGYPQQQMAPAPMMAPQPMMGGPQPMGGAMPYGMNGATMIVAPPGSLVITPAYPDLLSAFAASNGLFIKQRINLLEMITACEMSNVYEVWQWDPVKGQEKASAGKSAQKLAIFREKSHFCMRQFCGPNRGFKMSLTGEEPLVGTAYTERSFEPEMRPDAIVMERPFICCTFYCFNRPIMHVRTKDGYIATVRNPWTCLRRIINVGPPVRDDYMEGAIAPALEGAGVEPWYTVRANYCQWAQFFNMMPCGPCKKYTFHIYKFDDKEYTSPVGELARVWPGCLEALLTDSDSYTLKFPEGSTPHQKAALAASTVLADFLYFEKKPKDKNNLNLN